jgi:hypothetical protein
VSHFLDQFAMNELRIGEHIFEIVDGPSRNAERTACVVMCVNSDSCRQSVCF